MRSTHTFNINAYGGQNMFGTYFVIKLHHSGLPVSSTGSGTHTEVLVSIPTAGRHRSTGAVGIITRQNSVGVAATEVERRRDVHIHSQPSE